MKKITIIGDIMCEPSMIKISQRDGSYDFSSVFCNVRSLFQQSDYVIGNLETPLAGANAVYCNDLYSFNAPDEFAAALRNAGIKFVTTANNHSLDRGYHGLTRTIDVLERIGISHCGTSKHDENRIGYFNLDGIRFAIVCGTYGTNFADNHEKLPEAHPECVNLLRAQDGIPFYNTCIRPAPRKKNMVSRPVRAIKRTMSKLGIAPWKIQQVNKWFHQGQTRPFPDNFLDGEVPSKYTAMLLENTREARKNADFVIFYPHMGGQFNSTPGTFSDFIMNLMAESGLCDIIVSSHPHIVQKAEIICGIPCFYSLGNFCMSPSSYYIPDEARTDLGLAIHLYFSDIKLERVSYSILKILEYPGGKISVSVLDVSDINNPEVKYITNLVNGNTSQYINVNNEVRFL